MALHPATLEELKIELFLRRRNNLSWTTRNGNIIPISKLTDRHLENIIRHLEQFEDYIVNDDNHSDNRQYFDERNDSLF